MQASIQLCTYNRSALLERVLDACFEQTAGDDLYEVVLVNDGSTDRTREVIERVRARATCPFLALEQPNGGLAKARNTGIAAARGARIIFIDDDVLPLPNFVEEHLRAGARGERIVRGGAINVESFDDLPPPVWSPRHYSANYFWTTNVSVSLATIRAIGGFNETFSEYGWEDIDVGLRLRAAGVRATFNPRALVYHYKPPLRGSNVEAMQRQARAQARTAVILTRLHPQWRARLATGDYAVARLLHRALARAGVERRSRAVLRTVQPGVVLTPRQRRAARRLATEAYFDELGR
jgi:glycosyltransferase involved in cell wall biosynthesis